MSKTKNTDLTERFPAVLKELRLQKGISQEELADRASLHRTYISQIERGLKSPSLRSLGQIADALEVTLSNLIKKMEK
ncbi:helix-turn-helix domain-containing protein [Sulfuriflexus mobilis]|uniref:helix-turn-helix domain-containing protein n=1 Tax=Sulfuriflexus mobilis TaxID=1811807 RepID=UPI000F81E880|nr:helix-turn-helix transcriptional regulator [Sulfuriflexus mobilis]